MNLKSKLKTLLILIVTFFSLSANSQTYSRKGVTSTQLFQHVKEIDGEIDELRTLSKSVYQVLQDAEEIASDTPDPQRTLDFILLRCERYDSYVQLALAEKAEECAGYLSEHKHDDHGVAGSVIQEGIDKYNNMCSFFLNRAKQLRASFTKHWNNYSSKYGTSDQEIFVQDDEELESYGIETD